MIQKNGLKGNKMSEDFDKERLWKDVKKYVENRINSNDKEMYTNSQKKRFWVKAVTNSYIRVEREKSKLPHEDTYPRWTLLTYG